MPNNWLEPNSPIHKVWKPERKPIALHTPPPVYACPPPYNNKNSHTHKTVYKIQLEAPTPKAILRQTDILNPPKYYGYEYHGTMNHQVSESILDDTVDGSYLVRQSRNAQNFYTLSLRFGHKTKHYKIYYKPNWGHYLKEDFKRFETIHELVADGLVNFYMQMHAAPIIQEMMAQTKQSYQQSPYMTLNRRKLKALSNDLRKSLKSELAVTSDSTTDLLNATDEIALPMSMQDELEILPIVYEKAHNFKVHTFKGLNWCEFCANFLWGFTAQGVKCEGDIIGSSS